MNPSASILDQVRARRAQNALGERARILFVDDEERILRTLQALFRMRYEVTVTTDGRQAIELLKERHFHLIVSDQRMPEIQGIEVLRQAKEISPRTVRILLTGFADLSAIIGSVNDGEVFRYINKPWSNEELERTVSRAVEVGKALAEVDKSPVAEVAQQPAPGSVQDLSISPEIKGLSVLFLEQGKQSFQMFQSRDIQSVAVETANQALDVMQAQAIAVIVIAIDRRNPENLAFLNLLKREHPQVIAIVISDMADSSSIINLVNASRVFRVLFHPVKPGALHLYIHSALRQAAQLRDLPALVETQKPGAWDEATASAVSRFTANVGNRLQTIKSFFVH